MASVYGGGENGRVANDTHVTIKGDCQIGCGEGKVTDGKPVRYTTAQWTGEDASNFTECASWDYRSPYWPHDPYGGDDAALEGTDGHTYYGSVFGGGSGYYPYKKADGTHEWLRSAGQVYGNTVIDITGGHILTSVYGGNETTDVGTYTRNVKGNIVHADGTGKCTINMVGGTIGVPRTDEDAQDHPVTCYLFGAGKGDQRTRFNTWTNVQETEVNVSGTARIFGSVFGGGEDGHILGDAHVNIGGEVKIDLNGDGDTDDTGETFTAQSGLKIGTTGTSYVDGNVFGGGRGFSGLALTAGSTGGNATVTIAGGTMLGSIYGGGRLASVGIDFTPPTDPLYGQLVDDTNEKTHGHIAINISGGTIGNDVANAKYGGNVFGGSMGRITLLDESLNPIWPKQAVTKDTEITIIGNPVIKRNVYGGSEFGIVRDKAIVNIGGTRDKSTGVVTASGTPTIHGSVFGAGYGSDDNTPTFITAGDYAPGADYVFTPMIWTGCVSGDTEVNIAGGTVEKNVYGGGEVASVGLINCHVVEDENGDITIKDEHNVEKKYRYTNLTKHDDIQGTGTDEKAYGFALSWPYKFEFISGDPRHPENIGGKATVNITGGHIGSDTWDDRSGYVFGGSKGQVAFKKKVKNNQGVLVDEDITDIHEQRYVEGLCANVRETEVNIKYSSTPSGKTPLNIGTEANCIMGAVYGGGEDGHVYENATVNITGGLIGLSVYGGGKGEGTYKGKLYALSTDAQGNLVAANTKSDVPKMPSWTAGKIYGNTSITMSDGHVMGNVYGGGNLGSVGKGNYAGGTDDYYPAGYGETLTGNLWDNVSDNSKAFLASGKCTINITGGTVGTLNGLYGNVQGTSKGTPTGIVFGGSRGRAAQDVGRLSPRYEYAPDFFLGYVNNTEVIIGTRNAETGPTIYSQVFGGARDGHVRGSAKVEVNSGTIGQAYDVTQAVGDADVDYQRYHRGNVYGAGSGLGTWDGTHHGTSSGSVTRNTTVDIYGGTIYNNVYGGGAMATVGPPAIPPTAAIAGEDWSKCTVNIYGGTIGNTTVYDTHKYGGTVYGGSRGDRGGDYHDLAEGETIENYATVLWTEVNINPHPSDRTKDAVIAGNVYGGARGGQVKKDTKVNLTGGVIKHNAYGGGRGTTAIAADVLGNTTVELNNNNNGADADGTKKGCSVDKVFGCNDLNGTPKGHVLVHVYATQTNGGSNVSTKAALPPAYSANKASDEGYKDWLTRLINETNVTGGLVGQSVITDAQKVLDELPATAESTWDATTKKSVTDAVEAIDNAMNGLYDSYGYDVAAVYGGGDLAPYEPTSDAEKTEVIIEGCEVTSIKQVYGGGNAASVPATDVTVKSCYIIEELFGGGNGKDNYQIDNKWYENPGAHVGYEQFATYDTSGSHGTGEDEANKYEALVPREADDTQVGSDAAKAYRQANYRYGTGVASSTINGGHVHKAYGGSNEKGNISGEINSQLQQVGTCTIVTDGTYGGSKSADTDATIIVVLDCVENGGDFFGGSYKANINSDVNIHITNGTYRKIFGGNDRAGTINGKITITIEEYGCTPIRIGELYAGGNLAPYSVYGFKNETQKAKDANGNDIADLDQRIPYRAGEIGARTTPYWDPRINVISATRIGAIYGGGYGAGATLIGNPHINVNMTKGRIRAKYATFKPEYLSYANATDGSGDKVIPIGKIGSIYGGGNLASVEGDTYLEIGTGQWIASWDANGNPVWESTTANGDKYSYKEKTAAVYYNQAECDTYNSNSANNVTGYIASGTALSADQVEAVKKALGTSYVAGAELMTKDANAYNATLSGARKTTDVKSAAVYYTQDECNAYNATLPGAQDNTDPATAAAANTYNASLPGARKTSDIKTPAVYYTQAECDEYNKTHCTNYIAKHTKLSAAQATLVNNALTPSYSKDDEISVADANAYNATLPNALKTTDVKTAAVWAWYDENGTEMTTPPTLAPRNAATITDNVFGGGKGVAETSGATAFTCPKGMVGVDGDGIDYPEGGTSVVIANGTVGTLEGEEGSKTLKVGTGNVYGGGEVGRVEKNTVVTIGVTPKDGETITNTKFKPTVYGSVFGAGKGVATHGYSALVRGNSNVTIQGFAKVGQSVYGGGEIASIGRYNVVDGRPTSLKNPNSGNCIVTVCDNAEIGPNDMIMTKTGGPDNSGHVFGAGKGAMPYIDKDGNAWAEPWSINKDNGTDIYTATSYGSSYAGYETPAAKAEAEYLKFIETLALATHTDVTIGGNAFVKGDVFGGAEQGFVQHDTHVTIEGDCQIGNGYVQMNDAGEYLASPYSLNRRYTSTEWADGRLYKDGETNYTSSLPECASWLYGQASGTGKYAAHDIYANSYDSKGGSTIADNGSTFYGNVFGGGSGYFPYAAGKWHWKAGDVGGNTLVEIKGGHVLTNVYGGNELTNVTGKCTVEMSGGTIGVPRTLGQIAAHPVTCYLFGGGKGDPRVLFNKQTNAQDVEVKVTGGWVYGSVFGGGEDGHVLRNVDLTISGGSTVTNPTYADYYAGRATKIGTWGTSYVDGNIFGGGRGFAGDAYTAGNVAGCVNMTISGGTILGSVYGGGRLGSVGYGLYDAGVAGYGEMRDDNKDDEGNTVANFKRGHVDITISGGTIGNDYEYKYIEPETTIDDSYRSTNHIPYTEFGDDKHLTHTKGGNVFTGGMGRLYQLDGTTAINDVDWWKLGNVKSTKLTITGGTIKSNVYGGCEMGMVQGTHTSANRKDVSTEIIISGGTIGTEITKKVDDADVTQYTFGSVFGGGYGSIVEKLTHTSGTNPTYATYTETYPKYIAGRVKGSTEVTMTGGAVKASVYGGGEMAAVGESKVLATPEEGDPTVLGETLTGAEGKAKDGHTYVTVSGGTIGIPKVEGRQFGGGTMGNVYGGGSGYINTVRSGQIYGNTNVNISGTPTIYHNVYGGGAYGTVGDFTYTMTSDEGTGTKKVTNIKDLHEQRAGTGTATVTITGGTIGVDGHENGMVFGSSRGEVDVPGRRPDWLAWVNTANVTIGTTGHSYDAPEPQIMGSVYGSGENGHTYGNTTLNIHSGVIGDKNATKETFYKYRGNVYGGGCGEDKYCEEHYNPTAGIVRGNTEINIDGGLISGSVYGAGAVASVGYVESSTKHDVTIENEKEVIYNFGLSWPYKFVFENNTGKTTINITGGHIGIDGTDGGDVYGSARGEAGDRYTMAQYAYVNNAEVNVNFPSTASPSDIGTLTTPCITGSVHGSGENGYVYGDTKVTLNNGLIGHSLYGAGKGIGTYKKNVPILAGANKGQDKERNIYGLLSGKVLGNTLVTMNGGQVVRNVYGGGNMASVGKGNYAGGTDDYSTGGYGELPPSDNQALWENEDFLKSGSANVRVFGGTVGDQSVTANLRKVKNGLPYGNVLGGSAGEAAPNIYESPRYHYCPAFFSGYVNETKVTIGGGYKCIQACNDKDSKAHAVGETQSIQDLRTLFAGLTDIVAADGTPNASYWKAIDAPTILSSVYGGGQDGHVRRDTYVIVNGGTIGLAYNAANQSLMETDNLDDPLWLFRGNVFGGGSGVNTYKFDFDGDDKFTSTVSYGRDAEHLAPTKEEDYSTSAGSVTRFTDVKVLGGTIHRNVYGGGSIGSVGAPKTGGQTYDPYKPGQPSIDGKPENVPGRQSLNKVTIGGAGAVTIGTPEEYQVHYGGEVYGACRGDATLNANQFGTSVWTQVFIKNGATIQGNVFGGGDSGKVKKDTDVRIGESE